MSNYLSYCNINKLYAIVTYLFRFYKERYHHLFESRNKQMSIAIYFQSLSNIFVTKSQSHGKTCIDVLAEAFDTLDVKYWNLYNSSLVSSCYSKLFALYFFIKTLLNIQLKGYCTLTGYSINV